MPSPNYLMDIDGKYERVSENRDTYYRLKDEHGEIIGNYDSKEDMRAVNELYAQEDRELTMEVVNEITSVVRYISVM